MPFEVVQYPNTSPDTSGTEITVHWSRDSHVQLEVVRHVWAHVCPNGCDGINTGCSDCPRGTVEEFDQAKTAVASPCAEIEPNRAAMNIGGQLVPYACCLDLGHNGPHKTFVDGQQVAQWPQGGALLDSGIELTGEAQPIPVTSDLPAQIWTQPLNRGEINKLIRVLRRARDQAYGKDE